MPGLTGTFWESPGRDDLLVLRPGGLGDLLLTVPTLRALRERHPTGSLWVAGRPEYLMLLLADGLVSRAVDFSALFSLFGGAPEREILSWLEGFSFLYSFVRDACLEEKVSGIAGLRAFWREARRDEVGKETEDGVVGAASWLGKILGEDFTPQGRDFLQMKNRNPDWKDRLVLHPGSGSVAKNPPPSCWRKWVAAAEREIGLRPLVVLGEAEAGRRDRWQEELPWPYVSGLSSVALAEGLAGAAAYLGADSGVTHLAGLLGVPVVAVFGPSDPGIWAPLGSRTRILLARPWEGLGAREVVKALRDVRRRRLPGDFR